MLSDRGGRAYRIYKGIGDTEEGNAGSGGSAPKRSVDEVETENFRSPPFNRYPLFVCQPEVLIQDPITPVSSITSQIVKQPLTSEFQNVSWKPERKGSRKEPEGRESSGTFNRLFFPVFVLRLRQLHTCLSNIFPVNFRRRFALGALHSQVTDLYRLERKARTR